MGKKNVKAGETERQEKSWSDRAGDKSARASEVGEEEETYRNWNEQKISGMRKRRRRKR